MSDPSDSLVLPDFSTGYRPPRFFDYTLELDPQLAALAQPFPLTPGWHLQPRLSYSRLHLGLTYGDLDDVLHPYLSSLSQLATQQPNAPLGNLLLYLTDKSNPRYKGEATWITRELALDGKLDDAQRARLADIAERTPVTLMVKNGTEVRTTLR